VAQSLESGLNLAQRGRPAPEKIARCSTISAGFGIIRSRTEALAAFWRRIRGCALPAPKLAPLSVHDWISRVAMLETRVKVKSRKGRK